MLLNLTLKNEYFFQLDSDYFRKSGLTDKTDELFWRASFIALPTQFSGKFSDYLQLKSAVESKNSRLVKDTPQEQLSNHLKITVVHYKEHARTVSRNPQENAIIYIFEDKTGCYPLISVTSLIDQPQRILELMRIMASLRKTELSSSTQTVSVSGLTSRVRRQYLMTSSTASSTESPVSSITHSPSQVPLPGTPGTGH